MRVFRLNVSLPEPSPIYPNTAGGKTVVLKTLGLVALMARTGIPIPAAPGARVDLFDPVLADIGDLQSVTGDLSTFSGHLVVRVVLCGVLYCGVTIAWCRVFAVVVFVAQVVCYLIRLCGVDFGAGCSFSLWCVVDNDVRVVSWYVCRVKGSSVCGLCR